MKIRDWLKSIGILEYDSIELSSLLQSKGYTNVDMLFDEKSKPTLDQLLHICHFHAAASIVYDHTNSKKEIDCASEERWRRRRERNREKEEKRCQNE